MSIPTELITLREAAAEDLPFLARLYCDSRHHEVAAWGWPIEQQKQFLQLQFEAQYQSYRANFTEAVDRIVCLEDTSVGRVLVGREAEGFHLMDIALLAEHRNCGIGTFLLQDLLKQCQTQGCNLRLQALQGNPAIRLYQRQGFHLTGADSIYIQMEWTPS